MAKKPPLEVVRTVRQRALDDAARAMQTATRERQRAEDLAARAAHEESTARAAAESRRQSEESALAAAMSPRELAQLAAFELAERRKLELAAERTAAAAALEAKATEKENARRGDVVRSRTGLDVVEKVQDKWRADQRDAEQAAIDEAAEEAHAARRRR